MSRVRRRSSRSRRERESFRDGAPALIRDAADPRLAPYRDLRDPALRERTGLFVVEGRLAVERLLAGRRFRIRSILATPAAREALPGTLAGLAGDVLVAGNDVIRAVVGFAFHRGCLALAERGGELSADALLGPPGPRTIVALDEVADPENVGAVFRNAVAFDADAALISAGTADPLYRKAIRVSAAATLALPFARVTDWRSALAHARATGHALVALTPDRDGVDVDQLGAGSPLPPRLVLVVGSESSGLGPSSRASADLRVRIPMADGVDSLNVATAAAIALHRLRVRRRATVATS